jgi:hypothetical protein
MVNILRLIVPAFCVFHAGIAYSLDTIRINEFMASNIHAQLNSDYSGFEDWIELYNAGDTPADLSGTFLTDDFSVPFKWQLPDNAIIEPKSFLIIWADGLNHGYHASFKLSGNGEQIGLYQQDGTVIDTVTFGIQPDDISFGRFPDGGDEWHFFANPTFNHPDSVPGLKNNFQATKPNFSPAGGLYADGQLVSITSTEGASIRYTTNGSLPTLQSAGYSHSIYVDSTMVIRAQAFQDNVLPSDIVTHTYIINEPSTLPVISITTPPEFLFDEEIGITVGIPVSDTLGAPPPFDPNANFWHQWERPVHFEFYESEGDPGLNQDAGIAVFGGLFGRQIRQKAFTIYARDKYGDADIDYPLFPSKTVNCFKRFLLRCSSNDFNSTYIRDAMMNTLVIGQMDIDYQAYQPAVVYINGDFWGLYNIREKTNHFYPESNYGIDADSVDIVEGIESVSHGDGGHYQDLLGFIINNDMSLTENYQYVQTQMDVSEFMNYFITEIYVCNHDWLHQNIKCWREHSADGRWRWLLYDMDWGFGGQDPNIAEPYKDNSIQWVLEQGPASVLFQQLILNKNFRDEFAQRFATHLNLTFNPGRVQHIIEMMVRRLEPEMPRQIERWGAIQSMTYWHDQLDRLYEFGRERQHFVFNHLDETLNPGEKAELILEIPDSASGWITVDEIPGQPPVCSGLWYKNIPLRIQAHPRSGFRFVRWEGSFPSESDKLTVSLTGNAIMLAVFEPYKLPSIVISEIHYNPSDDLQGEDEIYEFIELFNMEENRVDISGYQFTGGISFTFPQGSYMEGGEYVIVAKTMATYTNKGYQVFQITSGRLDNAGEELCLTDSQGMVVDMVIYDDHHPWPEKPDGEGPSLELINPSLDNNMAAAWKASEVTGGTPGGGTFTGVREINHVLTESKRFQVLPNPFNTIASVRYSLDEECKVCIRIINLFGQEVAVLVNERQKAGQYHTCWKPENLAGGIYMVHFSCGRYLQTSKILYIK